MKKRKQEEISRREFVKRVAAGTAIGTAGLGALVSGLGPSLFVSGALAQEKGLKYRPLGNTGLKVSEISFGGIYIAEAAVLEAAIDKGINLIHTSSTYQRGASIRKYGQVLKKPGMRDKVALAIKDGPSEHSVDKALQKLHTDYVDIIVPPMHSVESVNRPELPELFARLKIKKKVRFCGFACHKDMANVMQAAIRRGIFDVMLVRYNLHYRASLDPVLARAKRAGIGFMAMKTVKDVRRGSFKNTLKILLQNKDVDTLLVGMKSFQDVVEDISASG